MPFYDFYCPVCGHKILDLKRNIVDVTIQKCPICKNDMKFLYSPPMLDFKGGGWAKDGYSTKKKGKNK